jgi:hypothetical protein
VDPALVTAALNYRSNARIALNLRGVCIPISIFTKGNQQSGSLDGSCAWQCCKEIVVGKTFGNGIDLGIKAIDGQQKCA